jgi:haloacetate dehalogenase
VPTKWAARSDPAVRHAAIDDRLRADGPAGYVCPSKARSSGRCPGGTVTVMAQELFPGFTAVRAAVNGITINAVRGGTGPAVLMLHGHPQTHAMWHQVAPRLARRFTVVCADLRGYGDSAKPESDPGHMSYAKRVMAEDQVQLMQALGFDRFAVVGHDRGARVGRRLALDHPELVCRLALLDIVPTHTIYSTLDQRRAINVWRYFLLVQPPDLPERLIGADPDFYLTFTLREWSGTFEALSDAAVSEYRRCFDRDTIRASCEDYRAGATVDLVHDADDADRRIHCPVLVLWSASGIGATYDVLSVWRQQANNLQGHALECGHFLAEERPDQVAQALDAFLSADA